MTDRHHTALQVPAAWAHMEQGEQTLLYKIRDHTSGYAGSIAMTTFDAELFDGKVRRSEEFGANFEDGWLNGFEDRPSAAWAQTLRSAIGLSERYRDLVAGRPGRVDTGVDYIFHLLLAGYAAESVDLEEALPLVRDLRVVAKLGDQAATAHVVTDIKPAT